jgi:2-methylcitrate dehydratase PrpD
MEATAPKFHDRAANQSQGETTRGEQLVEYITSARQRSIPPEVLNAAKFTLVDYVGVAVGAYYDAPAIPTRKTALSWGAQGKAHMYLDQPTTPALAALVNGTMAHCMDFDDAHTGGAGHVSAALWAATLSLAEHVGASEQETIAAFLTGFEVMTKLGGGGIEGVGRTTARRGFHPTPIYGTPGCAAAASVLLKLDHGQAAYAMGAAATMASGLVGSFGTHAKPFHAGMAAMDGIHAAQLASNGFVSATNLYEKDKGFLDAIIQNKPDTLVVPPLEFSNWEILVNGYKPYACCRATHSSSQAARTLAAKVGQRNVKRVVAKVHKNALVTAGKLDPKTPLECKFSVPFCIAMALRGYALVAPDFCDATLRDKSVAQIVPTVELVPVDDQPQHQAYLDVWMEDGEHLQAVTTIVIGHPDNPMSWEDMHTKFTALVRPIMGEQKSEQLYQALRQVEKPGTLKTVFGLLATPPLPQG